MSSKVCRQLTIIPRAISWLDGLLRSKLTESSSRNSPRPEGAGSRLSRGGPPTLFSRRRALLAEVGITTHAAAAGSDLYHGAARAGPAQQRRSSAYQALPLTAAQRRGPRGPMVPYCGTLTGFHSAPSQPIVSRRREHALDVLEREHGAGNVSHQILRFGPFSKVLPCPPTAFNFDICVALKRVAQDRLHQHCRGLSEQHRTTRSRFEMQASTTQLPSK